MKWLFFILLLANLGLFLLIYPQGSQDNGNKKVLSDIGELVLLNETVEHTDDAGNGEPITPQVEEKLVEFQSEKLAMDLPDEPVNELGVSGETAVEPASSQISEPPVSAQPVPSTVRAVNEAPVILDEIPETVEKQAMPDTPVCRTIGFLESRAEADIVSVRLRALGLKPDIQSETRNEQAGVWVLIPPQPSRSKAIEIANRLEKDGISDLWRFTSGKLVHAISLGLFRDGERAEARRKEITELGYKAIIKPRYRQMTNYWLYYQDKSTPALTQKSLDGLLADFPNLETKVIACQ